MRDRPPEFPKRRTIPSLRLAVRLQHAAMLSVTQSNIRLDVFVVGERATIYHSPAGTRSIGNHNMGITTMRSLIGVGISAFAIALVLVLPTTAAEEKTIVEIAIDNKDFSTLVKAVKAADLVETLNGDGPFTVLAPTNAAFEKVEGLDKILADKAKLKKVLMAHVIKGKVLAKDVVGLDGKMVKPLAGEFPISVKGGEVKIGNAKVVKTDIPAKNGVIHVIDTVLVPE